MSYPGLYDQLPTRRIATANCHGARIARLLAVKMGLRPAEVLPLMARPLAREAARALGLSDERVLADLAAGTEKIGGRDGR